MAGVASLQRADPRLGTVSRSAQTSAQAGGPGVPFARISRKAAVQLFDVTGVAIGSPPNLPTIKPVAGYHRRWRLEVIASGGSAANSPAAADGPYNVINNMMVRDPYGATVYNVDGYSLYLIDAYGGQVAPGGIGNDISKAPSFSGVVTTTGNFTIPFYIPFELDSSGYCSFPGLSAAAQPQLLITTNLAATVYATTPSVTVPTLEFRAYSEFWAAPVDSPETAPPGVGSSAQWSVVPSPVLWALNSNTRLALPRVGTYIHTLILVMRDSGAANARVDDWPLTDLTLFVDNVPIRIESFNERIDAMFQGFGITRPAGVIAYTFRDSVTIDASQADTHDLDLYTTPATLLEIGGTSQGGGTGPYRIQQITGELWPVGGVPYTHLAE
ncbi:MAG: hypothetical protein ACYDAY_12000 [Candidatus Dormibacteria bacterium]